jgi:succinoglycan biosynthesis transport protein ExoP
MSSQDPAEGTFQVWLKNLKNRPRRKDSAPVVEIPRPVEDVVSTTPVFETETVQLMQGTTPVATIVLNLDSMVAEEFRILRARVRALDEERSLRCVGLVSATSREGKSTTALGLATALSQEPGRKVLLLEADLRRPALEACLGLPLSAGVGEWLRDRRNPIPVRRLLPQGFYLMSAGKEGYTPPELLGSEAMDTLLRAAREAFDWVVVDCPPLLPVADAVVMEDLLDGFLFVARARHSPRETLQKAVARLKPDKIRGTIFNARRDVLPGYDNHGHRQYRPGR